MEEEKHDDLIGEYARPPLIGGSIFSLPHYKFRISNVRVKSGFSNDHSGNVFQNRTTTSREN